MVRILADCSHTYNLHKSKFIDSSPLIRSNLMKQQCSYVASCNLNHWQALWLVRLHPAQWVWSILSGARCHALPCAAEAREEGGKWKLISYRSPLTHFKVILHNSSKIHALYNTQMLDVWGFCYKKCRTVKYLPSVKTLNTWWNIVFFGNFFNVFTITCYHLPFLFWKSVIVKIPHFQVQHTNKNSSWG